MAFDIPNSTAVVNAPPVPMGGGSVGYSSGHDVSRSDFSAKLGDSVDRMRQQAERQAKAAGSSSSQNAPQAPNVPVPKPSKALVPETRQATEPSSTRETPRSPERVDAPLGRLRSRAVAQSTPEPPADAAEDGGPQQLAPAIDGLDAIDASTDDAARAALDKGKHGTAARPGPRTDDPAAAMLALLADHRLVQSTPDGYAPDPPCPARTSATAIRGSSDASLDDAALAPGDMRQALSADADSWSAPLSFAQALAAPPAHAGKQLLPDMAGDSNPGSAMPLLTPTVAAPPLAPEMASLASSTVLSMSTPQDFAASTTLFATRAFQDGTTQAVLRVSPDALGPVEARVQLTRQADGSSLLSMTLTMSNAQALETARQSMADLQQALSAAGLPPVNLTLRLEAPVAPPQSNGSSQSALHSGQQFDGSGGNRRQHNGGHAQNGGWRESGDQPATAWTPTRLFDKSA